MQSNPIELRRIREAKGHTQSSLSQETGVAQGRISQYERQPTTLWPTTAKRLAEALAVDIADITTSDTPEPVTS